MKENRKAFIILEIVLAAAVLILTAAMLVRDYQKPHRVSVILRNPEESQWAALRFGLKQAAKDRNVALVIAGTGDLASAEDEKEQIQEEIDNGAKALIVEPSPGSGTGAMLEEMSKKIPILLIESKAGDSENLSYPAAAEADNYAMGQAAAKDVLKDFSGRLDGKRIGILSGSQGTEAGVSRKQGCLDILKDSGGTVIWTLESMETAQNAEALIQEKEKADIIIALNDPALEAAGKCNQEGDLKGALLYGIGNSTETVYYLDQDLVRAIIAPDEFMIGYQAVCETAESLDNFFRKPESRTADYRVLRRDTLFAEENQQLLFAISQ